MQEYTEKYVTVVDAVRSLVIILRISALCNCCLGCLDGHRAVCRVFATECSFSMGQLRPDLSMLQAFLIDSVFVLLAS